MALGTVVHGMDTLLWAIASGNRSQTSGTFPKNSGLLPLTVGRAVSYRVHKGLKENARRKQKCKRLP